MWSRFFGASGSSCLLLKMKANHRFQQNTSTMSWWGWWSASKWPQLRSWTKAWGYECEGFVCRSVSPRWPVVFHLMREHPLKQTYMEPEKRTWKLHHLWRNICKSASLGFHVRFLVVVSLYKVGWCRRTLQNHHQKCGCTMRCEFLWQCEKRVAVLVFSGFHHRYWGFKVVWHDLQRSLKQVIVLSVTSIQTSGINVLDWLILGTQIKSQQTVFGGFLVLRDQPPSTIDH